MSEVHEAVGCYVVDALEPAERDAFEAHLPTCHRCRLDVVEFREAIAELSCLVATPAPAELRASILDAVAQDRSSSVEELGRPEQRAPLTATPARSMLGTSGFAGAGAGAGAGTTFPTNTGFTDEVAPLEEHPSVVPDWTWSVPVDPPDDQALVRSRRLQRILTALVAAVVVVALALGGWVYALAQRTQAQTATTQRETELLGAPDAKVFTSTVNGASVVYVVSRQRDQALFMASNLTDLGEAGTYQLWTLRGTTATSAGLVTTGGTVRQWLSGSLRESDGLAVTHETSPAGSTTPTLPPLSRVSI